MSELRVGDRVELVGEVVAVGLESDGVCLKFGEHSRWVAGAFVRAGKVLPYPLAVGDVVKFKDATPTAATISKGEIVAIKGDEAFVDWTEPARCWSARQMISDLERA